MDDPHARWFGTRWVGPALGSLGSVAVLSALLYYFGWVHTAAQAKYFGFDSTFYDMSSADYTIRSTGAALPAVAVGVIVLLGVAVGLDELVARLADERRRRLIVRCTLPLGVLLVVLGVIGLVDSGSRLPAWPAMALLGGSLLAAVGVILGRARRRTWVLLAIGLLGLVGAFDAIRVYATTVGIERAERSALEMDSTALVRVYASEDPQLLVVGSLVRDVLTSESGQTIYRYDCLHLLDRIGQQLFLVPHGYSTDANRRVVYVVDVDDVRVDIDARYVERRETPPCS